MLRSIRRLKRKVHAGARALLRLPPSQLAVAVAMVASLVAGGIATAILLSPRPVASAPAQVQLGPPLDNPNISQHPRNPAVPATVRLIAAGGGIDMPVIEGDGVQVPLSRAMHYPGTSEPGSGGNALFYAHARPGMFLGLYRLHAGDEIRAIRSDGSVIRYVVQETRRVPWNDLDILRPTQFEQIILLTCTTYSAYDPRYIVIATPI